MATERNFIGNIECFVPGEDFSEYVERLNNLFVLNKVEDDKKVPFLISVMGSVTYRILKNLTAPTLPKDKKFEETIKILQEYFKPTPNKRAERIKFHRRNQKPNESIADYIVELKAMADSCVFGDFLDDALCDRLIGGLLNTKIQMKLINETKELTFEEAKKIALNYELTDSQLRGMKSVGDSNTNFVRDNRSRSKSRSTWEHRGRSNSNASNFYKNNSSNNSNKNERRCFICNEKTHFARFCKSNFKNNNSGNPSKNSNNNSSQTQNQKSKVNNFQVAKINSCQSDNSALNRKIKIEDKVVVMEVDTGACATLMEFDQFKVNFPNVILKPSSKNLRVVTGQNIIVVGVAEVKVQLNQEGEIMLLELIVVETDHDFTPLLGRSWLDHLVKDWRNLFRGISINGMSENAKVDKSLKFQNEFPEVFVKDFREPIEGFSATIHMKPDT